jgi:mono/diheme cytochrome c family protein
MTWRVIVGTLSFVVTMILIGYVAVTEQDRMANFDIAYQARTVETGGEIFESSCATCHGLAGQGVPGKGPALNTPDLLAGSRPPRLVESTFAGSVDNYVRLTIAAGRPRMSEWARAQGFIEVMPTWGENYGGPLRGDQVDALVNYIMNWGLAYANVTPEAQPTVVPVGTDITQQLPAGNAAAGEALATAQGCTACHIATTTGPAWLASADPTNKGVATRAAEHVADPSYTGAATDAHGYLFESIVQPSAYIVPGNPAYAANGQSIMPALYATTLSAQNVADLIAYLETLE